MGVEDNLRDLYSNWKLSNVRGASFLMLMLVFDFCCLVSDVHSLDTSKYMDEQTYINDFGNVTGNTTQ